MPSSRQEEGIMTRTPSRGTLFAVAGRVLPVLLVAASLVGCSSAYTIEPVGLTPVALNPDDWNGCWTLVPDGTACSEPATPDGEDEDVRAFIITVADPAAGVLHVTPVPRRNPTVLAWVRTVHPAPPTEPEGGELTAEAPAALRRRSDATFITIEDFDGTERSSRLLFLWIARSDERFLLWEPAAEAFGALVERGVLPGMPLGQGDVLLGHLDRQSLAEITGERRWDLFHWEEPILLWRVTRDGLR
jgi:hypothetical protein